MNNNEGAAAKTPNRNIDKKSINLREGTPRPKTISFCHHANESVTQFVEEPIILDLSSFDEYGNRTLPIYRRSVKLKFDNGKEEIEQPEFNKKYNGNIMLDYHSTTDLIDLENQPAMWTTAVLDDDVITTVTNVLQRSYPHILFVNPCITQCILYAKVKQVPLFLDPLAAKKYSHIFFVLNDSRNEGHSSHWSLLMFDKPSKRLFHFDSLRNTNYKVAYELSQKLCEYLNVWAITDVHCEQQNNSTDCGYYVVDNMLKLVYLLKHEKHLPPSQIIRLPSFIDKTKNYVANLYIRMKMTKID